MIEINSRPEQPRHPVKCAWCGKMIGWSRAEHSHGICGGCAERLVKNAPLFAGHNRKKEGRQ